jgi:hypothetical protein
MVGLRQFAYLSFFFFSREHALQGLQGGNGLIGPRAKRNLRLSPSASVRVSEVKVEREWKKTRIFCWRSNLKIFSAFKY